MEITYFFSSFHRRYPSSRPLSRRDHAVVASSFFSFFVIFHSLPLFVCGYNLISAHFDKNHNGIGDMWVRTRSRAHTHAHTARDTSHWPLCTNVQYDLILYHVVRGRLSRVCWALESKIYEFEFFFCVRTPWLRCSKSLNSIFVFFAVNSFELNFDNSFSLFNSFSHFDVCVCVYN